MGKIRVAVVGATGYSGAELVALLRRHPGVELCALTSSAGRKEVVPFGLLHPSLRGLRGPECEPYDHARLVASGAQVVLLATPNETSAEIVPSILDAGLRVIDLSGAYRLRDADAYPKWYGFEHPAPSFLQEARYSIPETQIEWQRADLARMRLIANPGCYATSVILALWPLIERRSRTETVIADCKSGVSGAGKRSELGYSFTELANNFKTYATTGHRHEPEIRQSLALTKHDGLVFVPHLLPVPRGILSTVYVPLAEPTDEQSLSADFARAFDGCSFVHVRPRGEMPALADVVGTPRCDIGFQLLPGGRRVLVVAALDNLLKGAASQAIQNLNLAFGLDETAGLI